MAAEVTAALSSIRPSRHLEEQTRARTMQPARAADRFPRIPLRDIESLPNSVDPQWRRYLNNGPVADVASSSEVKPPSYLLGRVVLASLFVGRHGRSWTDDEICLGHRTLVRCCRWIEEEASRWGVSLDVSLPEVYFQADDADVSPVELAFQPEGDSVGPLEAQAGIKAQALVARVASLMGFADGVDLARQVTTWLVADTVVWLVHLAEEGRSIALTRADRESPGLSLAICYAHEASFPEPLHATRPARVDAITVVHEVLHLFGASDKYGVSLAEFPRGSVPRRDVMRLEYDRLSQLVVGPMTADELGWTTRRLRES